MPHSSADEAGSGGGSGGAGATVVNNSSLKGKSLAFRDMPKVNMSLNLGDRLGGSAGSGGGAGGAGRHLQLKILSLAIKLDSSCFISYSKG